MKLRSKNSIKYDFATEWLYAIKQYKHASLKRRSNVGIPSYWLSFKDLSYHWVKPMYEINFKYQAKIDRPVVISI